jgi:transposase-like protein
VDDDTAVSKCLLSSSQTSELCLYCCATASIVTPKDVVEYFSDFNRCRAFVVELRWPDGRVRCPRCGSDRVVYLENAREWKCYGKHPKPKFSLKTGTIFEDSRLGLDKWLVALWLIVNCKYGITSGEIARALGVTQKSAWFLARRLREALRAGAFDRLPPTL